MDSPRTSPNPSRRARLAVARVAPRPRHRRAVVLLWVLALLGAAVLRARPGSAAAVPVVGPAGIDVASWQHPHGAGINWRAVLDSGQKFVSIKASQGTSYTNPYFAGDRREALAAGMIIGAYDYAAPGGSPVAEARHFLSVTGTRFGEDTMPAVLDLEVSGGLSPASLTAWTLTWLRTVQRATGRIPLFYSYNYFITRRMTADPALARYPLWYASYSSRVPQTGPGAWATVGWTLWQYTRTASVPGVRGQVDRSQFWGTQRELQRFALT